MKYTAEQKGLFLKAVYDDSITVYADDRRLKQILINLLSNAVKFTQKGGVLISVKPKTIQGNPVAHIAVKDTGVGIKESDLPRLFKEFSTLETHQLLNPSGTGLGLYLSLRLAHIMKGDIKVKSVFGKGTKFTVSVPMCECGSPALKTEEIILARKYQELPSSTSTARERKKKILVVDDSEIAAFAMQSMLKKMGIDSEHAPDGRAAIECVRRAIEGEYAAIFMDMNMPIMNGGEAAKILKRMMGRGEIAEAAIIAISGEEKVSARTDFDFICMFFMGGQKLCLEIDCYSTETCVI